MGLTRASPNPCPGAPHMKKIGKRCTPIVRSTIEQLDVVLQAVEVGTQIRKVAHGFGIPCSTLRNHFFDPSISWKRGKPSVLTMEEENEFVEYIKKMAGLGKPLILMQLQLKVVEKTQYWTTPWAGGEPAWSWMKRFRIQHEHLALQVAQGLKSSRGKGLCLENVNGFYTNLENVYALKNMILVAFGILMRVELKPARREEQSVAREKFYASTPTNFWWERTYVCIFLHQCKWRDHSKFLHLQMKAILKELHQKLRREHAWMIVFLFDKWLDHSLLVGKRWEGTCLWKNWRPLRMDGHCKTCDNWSGDKAKQFGLDVTTLPSHMSHVL